MDIKNDVIGIVGGMGSYATLNIFKRILDSFEAKKEWDRPRIIIDNACTLPSRSRALLYHEKYEEVSRGLASSVDNLINSGANIIIIASNTGHLFLKEIYTRVPQSREYIVNFIELLALDVKKEKLNEVLLLGTEATLDSNVYINLLNNTSVKTPDEKTIKKVNHFIEAVKQNKITDSIINDFEMLLSSFDEKNIILGCTELPVLYERVKRNINKTIFDPIDSFIKYIKKRG